MSVCVCNVCIIAQAGTISIVCTDACMLPRPVGV